MVIWTRWGILGVIIPTALIVIAMTASEEVVKLRMHGEDRKPAKRAETAEGAEATPTEEDPEEANAAKLKRAADELKRTLEQDKAIRRAKATGYLIGGLASAFALWPLGRWMNMSESRVFADQQTGQLVEAQVGGGHTLFFIPLEYWGFIWGAIGLFKFLR